MKPRPIKRKGCRNVGKVWDENHEAWVVVKLHPDRPFTFVSPVYTFSGMDMTGLQPLLWESMKGRRPKQ